MRFLGVASVTAGLLIMNCRVVAQQPHRQFMDHAAIMHHVTSATVLANSPRPLAQAVAGLSEEYGWLIDFEDPPYYSNYDLVDDTAPAWRTSHPGAKGVTIIAGGKFQSEFPIKSNLNEAPQDEEGILDKIVSDYNHSGNPGVFVAQKEEDGRFAVIGAQVKDEGGATRSIERILDTLISLQPDNRSADTTIAMILSLVSAKTGMKVVTGMMPLNVLVPTNVVVGGEDVSARALLLQTLSATKRKFQWQLFYDNDVRTYAFNLRPLLKAGS